MTLSILVVCNPAKRTNIYGEVVVLESLEELLPKPLPKELVEEPLEKSLLEGLVEKPLGELRLELAGVLLSLSLLERLVEKLLKDSEPKLPVLLSLPMRLGLLEKYLLELLVVPLRPVGLLEKLPLELSVSISRFRYPSLESLEE